MNSPPHHKFVVDVTRYMQHPTCTMLACFVCDPDVRWNKDQMHNRYVLTDRGGVMFGHGVDKDDQHPVGRDTVSLLDDTTCRQLMVDYSDKSQKLSWLGQSFSVTGA